jgi:hypothetical protein
MIDITPAAALEQCAVQQRRRIHESVEQLSRSVRERLDVGRLAREHLLSFSAGAAAVGLILGYGAAALFKGSQPREQ